MADNISVLDAASATVVVKAKDNASVYTPYSNVLFTDTAPVTGAGTATGALRVELPTNGTGVVGVKNVSTGEYETVAASATAQVLGGSGATGDFIASLLVIPATTSPGNVLLLDNATSITVFTGGASSVSNLVPFSIQLGMNSVSGAWKVTTGTNVSVIAVGDFT